MGYYGGNGARKVATVDRRPRSRRPAGLPHRRRDRAGRLRQLAQSASWAVPADRGLRHLLRPARAHRRHRRRQPHRLRRPRRRRPLRPAVPDLRHHLAGLQHLRRQQPLHRARRPAAPTRSATTARSPPARNAPEDWVFNAEYPMVRFLEANGYDVSYTSGVDTDRRGAELLEHKVFLSVGHDEYWSGAQRANVEAARDAGVNLAFFSGNEVFWKTRWENSIDGSGTPYRTLVSLQGDPRQRQDRPADPPTWTGTWRDPRFSPPGDGGRPENALTGTIFTVNCCAINMRRAGRPTARCGSGATPASPPWPPAQTDHRRHRHLGYEWDEDLDNGVPPGRADPAVRRPTGTGAACCRTTAPPTRTGNATHRLTPVPRAERRAGLRRRHRPVVLGPRRRPRPRLGAPPDTAAAAGDGQPVRRHGRAADHAAARADRGDRVHRHRRPDLHHHLARRRRDASASARPSPSPAPPTDTGGGLVGGVEVSTDGGATWHPATGRGSLDLHLHARRRPAPPTIQAPRRRRQRATSRRRRRPSPSPSGRRADPCPCTIWPGDRHARRRTDPDTGAVELGVKFRARRRGYSHRHPVLQGHREHRHPRRAPVDQHRHPARPPSPSPARPRSGWQQATLRHPGRDHGRHHLRRLLLRAQRPLRRRRATTSPPRRPTRGPLHRPAGRHRRRQRRLPYTATGGGFPNQTYQSANYWVDVVFTEARRHHHADRDHPHPRARRDRRSPLGTDVTATFSEAGPAVHHRVRRSSARRQPSSATTDVRRREPDRDVHPDRRARRRPPPTPRRVSGAKDTAGNTMDPATWTFTTADPRHHAADRDRPDAGRRCDRRRAGRHADGDLQRGGAAGDDRLRAAQTRPAPWCPRRRPTTPPPAPRPSPRPPRSPQHHLHRDRQRRQGRAGNTMDPAAGRSPPRAAASGCPCTIWASTATPARTDVRHRRRRARREVPRRRRRLRHRHPLLQARRRTPARTSAACGRHRHPARPRSPSPARRASGWQQASFATPDRRSPPTRPTSRRTRARRPLRRRRRLLRHARHDPRPLHRAGQRHRRQQRRLPLRRPAATSRPAPSTVDELLGRRRLRGRTDTTKPPVTVAHPAPGATGVGVGADADGDVRRGGAADTHRLRAPRPGGTLVATTTTYDAATGTATLDADVGPGRTTTYTANVSGVRDTAGNLMTPISWTFTTEAPDTTKPTRHRPLPAAGATDVRRRQRDRDVQRGGPGSHDHLRAAHARQRAGRRPRRATTPPAARSPSTRSPPGRPTTYTATAQRRHGRRRQHHGSGHLDVHDLGHRSGCPCTIWPRPRPGGTDDDNSRSRSA